MTKYIIQSGAIKKFPEKLEKYNKEIFKDFINFKKNASIKVLMCFFAMPREDWEEKYETYKKNTGKGVAVEVKFDLAMPNKFIQQCKSADVIFISGGDDDLIKCRLNKFDIPKIWKGKVVVTSSAASNYLVESFWTCDWRMNMNGKGIVPIKFIPHYKSKTYGKNDIRGPIDWKDAYRELEEYGNKKLPIYALEEGEFVVFEK